MSEFTDWLDTTVRALGYRNDAELARALDVDQSVVSRWRTGSQPNVSHLGKIGQILGIALEPLLVLSGHCEPSMVRNPNMLITAAERTIDAADLDKKTKQQLRDYWTSRMDEEHERLGQIIAVLGEHPRRKADELLHWLVAFAATTRATAAAHLFREAE
jgi:transcriptional regulator with XRE-family HTH domain